MIEQTFALTGPADLDVSVPAGSVAIEDGPAGSAAVTVDTDRPELWRVFQSGDTITVSLERTGIGRGGRARVRIVAPAASSLRVITASADVRARGALDRVAVNTASGDIHLGDANEVTVKTASGDLYTGTVSRDLTVRSASGEVRAGDVGGSVQVTTASGDVYVESVSESLFATSASGDISVRRYLGDDLEAATMSGDVEVGLPAGTGVELVATTLSGRVHLPQNRKAASSPSRQISVRLKSVSGDLRVRRVD